MLFIISISSFLNIKLSKSNIYSIESNINSISIAIVMNNKLFNKINNKIIKLNRILDIYLDIFHIFVYLYIKF